MKSYTHQQDVSLKRHVFFFGHQSPIMYNIKFIKWFDFWVKYLIEEMNNQECNQFHRVHLLTHLTAKGRTFTLTHRRLFLRMENMSLTISINLV